MHRIQVWFRIYNFHTCKYIVTSSDFGKAITKTKLYREMIDNEVLIQISTVIEIYLTYTELILNQTSQVFETCEVSRETKLEKNI